MDEQRKGGDVPALEELSAYPNWVAYDAKKIPIDPKTGARADTTDPATWSVDVEARARAEQDNLLISTQYSLDGSDGWSSEKFIKAGNLGETSKRLVWHKQGAFRNWRIQRFRGSCDARLSFARLEAQIEGLAW